MNTCEQAAAACLGISKDREEEIKRDRKRYIKSETQRQRNSRPREEAELSREALGTARSWQSLGHR